MPIADATRDRLHQLVVGNGIEVARQVRVDDLGMPRTEQPVDLPDGVQGTSLGPIGVLLRWQVRLEDRLQDQDYRHLRHAVSNRADAQWPSCPIRFREVHPTHGLGLVRLASQVTRQFVQPAFHAIRLDVVEGLAVDPRRPTVGTAAAEGDLQDVPTVHLVVEGIEPIAGRSLRFGMQRLLEFPNRRGSW